MAISVTTDLVDVNLSEATTNYAVLGTWATAIAASPDTYVQSSNTVGGRCSANTAWAHTSLTSTDLSVNELHIYQWLKCISIPQLDTKANGGLGITLSSDATPTLTGTTPSNGPTNSKTWYVGGNTDALSGWVCYVVDPNSTPDLTLGTPVITGVQRIGIRAKVTGTVGGGSVKPVNIVFDATRYGTGLTYTGDTAGTPGTFADILSTAMSAANSWGILTSDSSIYFGAGKFNFGTTTQSATSSFKSVGELFVWRNFFVANTFYAWKIRGAASFGATFQLGNYSGGLASGGSVVKGAGDPSSATHAVWTLDAGTNTTVNLYGSQFSELLTATLQSTSTIRGCTFSNFGAITTNGAVIDDTIFQNVKTTAPISSTYALIVASATEMSNVTNCKFVNCNRALKITTAGDYTFTGDTFTGNTYDIDNTASGANVTDVYSQTNSDGTIALDNTTIGVSQSFTGDGNKLANAVFYLSKSNTPSGSAYAKVYAHSGTFASSSLPTGTALATSKALDVTTLTGSLTLTTFYFADQNQNITLTNGTKYVVTIEYNAGTSSNTVNVGRDASGATAAGSCATLSGTTWTSTATTTDTCFYVRTGGVVTITPASGSNPSATKVINSAAIPGTVTINTGVNLTVNVITASQTNIVGAKVAVFQTSNLTTPLNSGTTNGSGNFVASITLASGTALTIRARLSSSGSTRYFPNEATTTVPSVDTTLTMILTEDTIVGT